MASKVIQVERECNFPVGRLWAVISAFGCEPIWLPGCTSSSVEGFGVGAIRTMTISNKPYSEAQERLEIVDPEQHLIRFEVVRDDLGDVRNWGIMFLTPVDEERTKLTWIAESTLADTKMVETLRAELDSMFNGGIDGILAYLSK